MGILNATPDSFAGDGRLGQMAIDSALQMIDAGADILDIGGESTRPGATKIIAEEEINRILPLLKVLSQRDVILSVDTSKAQVARAAVEHGVHIINDISGGTFDEKMFPLLASSNCGYILMHLRGTPQTMQWSEAAEKATGNVINEIQHFWAEQIQRAFQQGIIHKRIACDPGFGFGKSVEENLETLRCGNQLKSNGHPLICAVSRKSTIGKLLHDVPPEKRLWGTAACVAIAISNGYDVIRVHDVAEMRQVAAVADAIIRT